MRFTTRCLKLHQKGLDVPVRAIVTGYTFYRNQVHRSNEKSKSKANKVLKEVVICRACALAFADT